MRSPAPGDDELLAYACDELNDSERAAVETALAVDPRKAAEAQGMSAAFKSLGPLEAELGPDFNGKLRKLWSAAQGANPSLPPSDAAPTRSSAAPRSRRRVKATAVACTTAAALIFGSLILVRNTTGYGIGDLADRL